MLIAIAIIIILAAILFPSLPVRVKMRGAYCQSNLKQLGLAAMQYTQFNPLDPAKDKRQSKCYWDPG
jgi:hypothetical protein